MVEDIISVFTSGDVPNPFANDPVPKEALTGKPHGSNLILDAVKESLRNHKRLPFSSLPVAHLVMYEGFLISLSLSPFVLYILTHYFILPFFVVVKRISRIRLILLSTFMDTRVCARLNFFGNFISFRLRPFRFLLRR